MYFITFVNNTNKANSEMTGENLKLILSRSGVQLKDLAEKLEMSQQNFSNSLKVADVKTGLIERLCEVLNVSIDYFYNNTKYAPSISVTASGTQSIATNSGVVSVAAPTGSGDTIGTQNIYGEACANGEPSPIVATLTESIATLTRELETSQEQKSRLIGIIEQLTNK